MFGFGVLGPLGQLPVTGGGTRELGWLARGGMAGGFSVARKGEREAEQGRELREPCACVVRAGIIV